MKQHLAQHILATCALTLVSALPIATHATAVSYSVTGTFDGFFQGFFTPATSNIGFGLDYADITQTGNNGPGDLLGQNYTINFTLDDSAPRVGGSSVLSAYDAITDMQLLVNGAVAATGPGGVTVFTSSFNNSQVWFASGATNSQSASLSGDFDYALEGDFAVSDNSGNFFSGPASVQYDSVNIGIRVFDGSLFSNSPPELNAFNSQNYAPDFAPFDIYLDWFGSTAEGNVTIELHSQVTQVTGGPVPLPPALFLFISGFIALLGTKHWEKCIYNSPCKFPTPTSS